MEDSDDQKNLAKDEKAQIEQQKFELQLKELDERLNMLNDQYKTVIVSEEESASDTYKSNYEKFEKLLLQYREMEMELKISKARWDDAQKKSKTFLKQINGLKSDIDKIRKKLGKEEIYQEKTEKEYIIFKKDKFEDEDEENTDSELTEEEEFKKLEAESKKKKKSKGKSDKTEENEDKEKVEKEEKRSFFSREKD